MGKRKAAKAGLAGLVPLSGIPGTIGGALTMNAGAFGSEMKDVVRQVRYLDLAADGYPECVAGVREMAFSYRTSIAKTGRLCFLDTVFSLAEGSPQEIEDEMYMLSAMRREKQPLEYPSAGSTFKRPEGHFAGQLIMEAGLKGHRVGGAEVSTKHAGFVVNRGDATSADILAVIREVQKRVFDQTGVTLEPEVRILE